MEPSSPYTINIKDLTELPKCIICHGTIQDNAAYDLSYNLYCSCKFNYHQQCYEQWINLIKSEKCLICRNDISMNFIHSIPFYLDNSRNSVRRRASFTTINIGQMSPRTRHQYGIPFMYSPRRMTTLDTFANYICCRRLHRPNRYVNDIINGLDIIVVFVCGFLIVLAVVILIIIFNHKF
jgi:hypothetical protein